MTLKPARLLIALITIAASPAFAQNVAVVNGKPVPTSRVDAAVKQVVAQGQQKDTPELREMVKRSIVEREVLLQEALKRGFDKSPEVKMALESARQNAMVNAMAREFIAKNPVVDADLKAEYDRVKAQTGDKEYHVRHILLGTDAEAKATIAKLKAGSKFEELAKASKDTGSAATGGDLDWVSPSAMPKPFADAVLALKNGQVSETPVQTPAGFHVIKVDETRATQFPKFEDVKPQLSESMQQSKLAAFQDSLLKKATIK